jgi:glutamine cyclotransferase
MNCFAPSGKRASATAAKIVAFVGICLTLACVGDTPGVESQQPPPLADQVPVYTYEVVQSWPHDPQAFTQGLVIYDGVLYESAGLYGQSTLRRVELESGKVKKKTKLENTVFAEGLTLLGDRLYQLSWTNQKGFIYAVKDFTKLGEFAYDGEGWGLATDGTQLILSDGSNSLRFLEPTTGKLVRMVTVMDGHQAIRELNELEFVKGEVWANIWHTDRIARIDPASGKVLGWIDLSGLLPSARQQNAENVLNGIAYDTKNDRIFVTGKRWSRIFEIRVKATTSRQ